MLVQSVDLTSHPDEACRSLSVLTDSTEQSAPVNFDMSNRVSIIYFTVLSPVHAQLSAQKTNSQN
jgi:hypothetical protein